MSKLILKAIPANASSAAAEQSLGYIDTMGSTQRVSVKAQPKTVYRLVDAKTGEVIKNQTVLRQGKQLKVMVDGVNAVELDNFFPDEAANATAPVYSPSYLVDTGAAGAHSYPPELHPRVASRSATAEADQTFSDTELNQSTSCSSEIFPAARFLNVA